MLSNDKLTLDTKHCFCTKWFYGCPCWCSPGCCCNWSVPTNVCRLFWEVWGAGGNGHGACAWSRCHHYRGAGGGHYSAKSIGTVPGCSYTVCAGGVYRCWSQECNGLSGGCTSYVNGYNLSNFCARGGERGYAETSWASPCYTYWDCCQNPTSWGSDFGMGNHAGAWGGTFNCHCHCQTTSSTAAPFYGGGTEQIIQVCWMRCGCWLSPYTTGGQGAMSSYCGDFRTGQGNTGGSGLVKVTYQ